MLFTDHKTRIYGINKPESMNLQDWIYGMDKPQDTNLRYCSTSSHDLCINMTGTCQCTRAVWSTFADIRCIDHALFGVTGISGYLWYLIYPMIAISENTWSIDYFWHCRLVGLLKWKITEPSFTAFIGFPFSFVFTCTFTEWVTQHHEVNELDGYNHEFWKTSGYVWNVFSF